MKVLKQGSKIQIKTISSEVLRGSFSALEEIVNQDAKELETIDNDIRALQTSLKGLKIDNNILSTSEIDVSESEVLLYDFKEKAIVYSNPEGTVKLLAASPKVRKTVHTYFLDSLLSQIGADYTEAKAKEV